MTKEIRFSKLVAQSGGPETVTLWAEPEKDSAFMKAVRQNRVLTVVQRPSGHKSDFGTIGFLREQGALYLVFPKPLPKDPELHIVGIKYEMFKDKTVEAPKQTPPADRPPLKNKSEVPAPLHRNGHSKNIMKEKNAEPKTKTFAVKVKRVATDEVDLKVEAKNFHEAESKALEAVEGEAFEPSDVQSEVKSISQI